MRFRGRRQDDLRLSRSDLSFGRCDEFEQPLDARIRHQRGRLGGRDPAERRDEVGLGHDRRPLELEEHRHGGEEDRELRGTPAVGIVPLLKRPLLHSVLERDRRVPVHYAGARERQFLLAGPGRRLLVALEPLVDAQHCGEPPMLLGVAAPSAP